MSVCLCVCVLKEQLYIFDSVPKKRYKNHQYGDIGLWVYRDALFLFGIDIISLCVLPIFCKGDGESLSPRSQMLPHWDDCMGMYCIQASENRTAIRFRQ